jgi:hypothetical protein
MRRPATATGSRVEPRRKGGANKRYMYIRKPQKKRHSRASYGTAVFSKIDEDK